MRGTQTFSPLHFTPAPQIHILLSWKIHSLHPNSQQDARVIGPLSSGLVKIRLSSIIHPPPHASTHPFKHPSSLPPPIHQFTHPSGEQIFIEKMLCIRHHATLSVQTLPHFNSFPSIVFAYISEESLCVRHFHMHHLV